MDPAGTLLPDDTGEGTPATAGRRRVCRKGVMILVTLALVVLLVILASIQVRQFGNQLPRSGAASGELVVEDGSRPAPDFTLKLFDGSTFHLADQRGRPVVLNFWASWCTPCRLEMPSFETIYRAYRERGVVFIGVAVNDDPLDSRAFLKQLGITYPTGPDDGNTINLRYQVYGLPTTVFISRDGKMRRKKTGELAKRDLEAFVKEIAQ